MEVIYPTISITAKQKSYIEAANGPLVNFIYIIILYISFSAFIFFFILDLFPTLVT